MQPFESESLERRVSELERRFAELTGGATAKTDRPGQPPDVFWALEGLRERIGEDNAGAVLYTGTVDLPTGEHYEWQFGTPVDSLFDADWSAWAATLGALGHPVRLQLLRRVLAGTHKAADLAADESLGTTGQLYHHLRQLVNAGWLRSATRGQYTVPGERVVPLLVVLSTVNR